MKTKVTLSLLAAVSCISATTLSVTMTVDNVFQAFISTSDTVQGTLIGSGANWQVTQSFSTALTPGVTNFLHIMATDQGPPAMFLGDFTLNDTGFHFSNGTQHLLTNTTNWGFSNTGFTGSYSTPLDEGPNGTAPWGTFANIGATARFIWDNPACGNCTTFFSTAITPAATSGVPEPASLALLGGGMLLFWCRRRRG